jgi:hypothetical protein
MTLDQFDIMDVPEAYCNVVDDSSSQVRCLSYLRCITAHLYHVKQTNEQTSSTIALNRSPLETIVVVDLNTASFQVEEMPEPSITTPEYALVHVGPLN